MKRMHVMMSIAMVLAPTGCADADGHAVLDPVTPAIALQERSSGLSREPVAATGEFAAIVDFSTLSLTPRGRNCLLTVDGQLVFSGTIEGVSTGTTTALVFADCEEVMAAPGTHGDVFTSEGTFEGTIAGVPARGDMLYQGRSQVGGAIHGRIVGSGGIAGVLQVDAQIAVGGSYDGSLVVQ